MFLKISFFYESSKCILFEIRYSTCIKTQFFLICCCKVWWQNHIADSDCWCQCSWKCIHIYYLFAYIYAFHGRNCLPCHTEFWIIIIFYYISVWLFISPCKQFKTTAYRHCYACRIMMRRTYMNNICHTFSYRFRFHSFIIHTSITEFHIITCIYPCNLRISRIFNTVHFISS